MRPSLSAKPDGVRRAYQSDQLWRRTVCKASYDTSQPEMSESMDCGEKRTDVGVIDLGEEANLRRRHRVLFREKELQLELAACEIKRGVDGSATRLSLKISNQPLPRVERFAWVFGRAIRIRASRLLPRMRCCRGARPAGAAQLPNLSALPLEPPALQTPKPALGESRMPHIAILYSTLSQTSRQDVIWKERRTGEEDAPENGLPSGPAMMTSKYRRLSSCGMALIPGAGSATSRWVS